MKIQLAWLWGVLITIAGVSIIYGCGKAASVAGGAGGSAGSGGLVPMITPIVKSAAPVGFGGTPGAAAIEAKTLRRKNFGSPHKRTLSGSDIDSRFFQNGPTDLYFILQTVDGLVQTINSGTGACYTQAPVPFTLTPFGESVSMFAQCYFTQASQYSGDPAYGQFGIKDNLVYFYNAAGVERMAAIITPLDSSGNPIAVATEVITAPSASPGPSSSPLIGVSPIPSSYQAEIWIAIGFSQPAPGNWDSGSYGAIHLIANSVTKTFEMAVAGTGFGYCGAQLRSDGTDVYITGSADMGETCVANDTECVLASDGVTAGTCGSAVTTFSMLPLGRTGGATQSPSNANNNATGLTYGASQYPGGTANAVILNGTATDSLRFGPETPTTGVGLLSSP